MNTALFLLLFDGDGEASDVFPGPFRSVAGQFWTAGSDSGQMYTAGSEASQHYTPGSEQGQFQ